MAKFRKKPAVIEAVQWDGESGTANELIGEAYGSDWYYEASSTTIRIFAKTYGVARCEVGDWIVKNADGMLDVCKPDIFEQTYEAVE